MLADAGTGVPTVVSVGALVQQATAREVFDRARIGTTAVLTPLGAETPLVSLGLPLAGLPQPLPFADMRGSFTGDTAETRTAKQLWETDQKEFEAELSKKGKSDKAGVAEWARKWAAERGLETGTTTHPDTRYTLKDDPGVKPLLDAHKAVPKINDNDLTEELFARPYFNAPPGQLFSTVSGAPPGFAVWRTEEFKARIRPFEEVKAEVVRAWKLGKAREQIVADTKGLREKAEATKGDPKALRDLAAASKASVIELNDVARLVPDAMSMVPVARGGGGYRPYSLPQGTVIYPTSEMLTTLLEFRNKSVGDVVVLNDRPETHRYVAVLTRKDVPVEVPSTGEERQTAFARVWRDSAPGTLSPDTFGGLILGRQAQDYTQEILEQLRKEAKLKIEKTPGRERERPEVPMDDFGGL